jgi:hypothetical protein
MFYTEGKEGIGLQVGEVPIRIKIIPRMCYQNFNTYILGIGFSRGKVDHYVHSK